MLLQICTSAALVVVQTSNLQSLGVPDGGQSKSAPFRTTAYDQKDWKRTTLINQKFENKYVTQCPFKSHYDLPNEKNWMMHLHRTENNAALIVEKLYQSAGDWTE